MSSISAAKSVLRTLGAPPTLLQRGVEKMQADAFLPPDAATPQCDFTRAHHEIKGQRFPQTIAHRGYRSKYPENTMAAFKAAVDVGAHALETDIHLTKDDVVVLSHDATLSRCFGKTDKIVDLDWSYISTLKTIAEPHETMPRLSDLLSYLAHPEHDDVWVLLDIKLDNDSDKVMRLISKALQDATPAPGKPWQSRVVLGIWAAKYLPMARKYMPDYPVTHISFSLSYARKFFKTPNVSFNMLLPILQAPGGTRFIRECHEKRRPVYAWTVNAEAKMDWCIREKLDGVITDDPKLFLDVCERYDPNHPKRASLRDLFDTVRVWLFAMLFARMYLKKLDRPDGPTPNL